MNKCTHYIDGYCSAFDKPCESGSCNEYCCEYEEKQTETNMKGKTVWAVTTSDCKCDEPGYRAYVELFADRDDAMKHMENAVAQDACCYDTDPAWSSDRTMCEIGDRIVYCLDELEIK